MIAAVSRRDQIRMTLEEQRAYLENARTIILSTIDRHSYPHSVAMWFCVVDGTVHMTTFRKSQKVVNLRRDSRSTLLVESGDVYPELRGLMLRCNADVVDDAGLCLDVLTEVQAKHGGSREPGLRAALESQAAKRCVLRFHPVHVSSWDHRKLGGTY